MLMWKAPQAAGLLDMHGRSDITFSYMQFLVFLSHHQSQGVLVPVTLPWGCHVMGEQGPQGTASGTVPFLLGNTSRVLGMCLGPGPPQFGVLLSHPALSEGVAAVGNWKALCEHRHLWSLCTVAYLWWLRQQWPRQGLEAAVVWSSQSQRQSSCGAGVESGIGPVTGPCSALGSEGGQGSRVCCCYLDT